MSAAAAEVTLRVTKGDKNFLLSLPSSATVGELRRRVHGLTGVPATRQKLVGLVKSGTAAPTDDMSLAQINVKQNQRIVVFCTANAVVATKAASSSVTSPEESRLETSLLTVRSAVDALEQRVESAVASRDASQLRVCVAELERHTLALDELRSDNDAIRAARKAEVTRIQSLLAQLDAASGSL